MSDDEGEDIPVIGFLVANGHLPGAGWYELYNDVDQLLDGIDHDDLPRTRTGNKERNFDDALSSLSCRYFADSCT